MINDIYLINENYLKSITTIGDNVDSKYITPAIEKAQIMGLMPLIGEKLFDKLCTLVRESAQNDPNNDQKVGIDDPINADYKVLLDVYVSAYLVQKVQAELQFNLYAKQRNEGVVAYADLNTNQIGVGDIKYIINQFNQDAEFYGKRMTDYILSNINKYPEYQGCSCGELTPNRNRSEFCKITL